MNALCQVAQLAQRLLEPSSGSVEIAGQRLVAAHRSAIPSQAKSDPQSHQPLLSAIMDVPLETSAFRVGRLLNPYTRRANFLETRTYLGLQLFFLQRQSSGRAGRLNQTRVFLIDCRIMDQRGEGLAV